MSGAADAYKKIMNEAHRDLEKSLKNIAKLKEDKEEIGYRISLFKETDCPEMFEEEIEEFEERLSEIEAEILKEDEKQKKFQKILDHLEKKYGLSPGA
jgi:chromosome segregation ATPase